MSGQTHYDAMTADEFMHHVHANRALYDAHCDLYGGDTPRSERLKAVAGLAMFGAGSGLQVCDVCNCYGSEGDDCGRPPAGHTLVPIKGFRA